MCSLGGSLLHRVCRRPTDEWVARQLAKMPLGYGQIGTHWAQFCKTYNFSPLVVDPSLYQLQDGTWKQLFVPDGTTWEQMDAEQKLEKVQLFLHYMTRLATKDNNFRSITNMDKVTRPVAYSMCMLLAKRQSDALLSHHGDTDD